MYSLKRSLIVPLAALLAACAGDTGVNPVAELVDGNTAAITTASTITATYRINVGQSVRIVPKTSTRTSRLRWSTTNSSVASVSSTGTATGRAAGSSTVTVSGNGVLESYSVVVASTVTAPTATVTSFSLQPSAGVTITSGQTQQFTTSTTWSDGQSRTSTVTYTATGGTISTSGLFTAGNVAGTFMVIATCACTTPAIADTTLVSVVVPQLTSLTVSPKTASVATGATQQFAVAAQWSTGATTVPPVTWSATGGTVSASGLYTAPATAGTYRVIVAHTNGTVRDTATVTVTGGTNTNGGTSTPIAGAGPNQPAGFSPIYSNPMDSAPPANPKFDAYGFSNFFGSNLLTVMPEAGDNFLRMLFPAGTPGGADYPNAYMAGTGFSDVTNQGQLYIRVRYRVSANWTDNGNTGTKFFYFHQQEGNNHYVNLTGEGDLYPAVNLQSTFGFGGPTGPNHGVKVVGAKGQWHELEVLLKANQPGVYNGVLRIWLDGNLITSDDQMGYFALGQTPRFNRFYFNPTFGGGKNPVPADQSLDVAHWYVSGAP